jgi:hypothetical protein
MKNMMSVLYAVVILGITCPVFSEESSRNVVQAAASDPVPTVPMTPGEPMAHLQQQMAELQTRAAQVAAKRAVASSGFGGGGGWFGSSSTDVDRAWIVPSREMKPEEMTSIQEDMAVMSRILDKALDQADLERSPRDVFIGNPFGGTSATGQSLFLAGYGALFRIDVDFPLAGPAEQPKQEPVADKDPTWAKVRREIYEPGSEDSKGDDEDKYKPEKVDALKKALVESMKHASNIRALQATDKVVILMSGRRGGSSGPVFSLRSSGKGKVVSSTGYGMPTGDSTPATTLVVQAKKADIDALAGGTLTPEQFQQKVMMTSY